MSQTPASNSHAVDWEDVSKVYPNGYRVLRETHPEPRSRRIPYDSARHRSAGGTVQIRTAVSDPPEASDRPSGEKTSDRTTLAWSHPRERRPPTSEIPKLDPARQRGDGERPAVEGERDRLWPGIAHSQGGDPLSGGDIPPNHVHPGAVGGQRASIGCECQVHVPRRRDLAHPQSLEHLAGARVPQSGRPIGTGRGEGSAIGSEGEAGDGPLVPARGRPAARHDRQTTPRSFDRSSPSRGSVRRAKTSLKR